MHQWFSERGYGRINSLSGQSIAELLIGLGIAAIIISSAVGAIILTARSNVKTTTTRTAVSLEQEFMDDVRSVAEGKWQNLYNVGSKGTTTTYRLVKSGSPPLLTLASGTEAIAVDNISYTRFFSVENVNRDAGGNIISSGGTEDPSTQKITATVRWQFSGETSEVKAAEYLTRSRNEITWFTDWSGLSGVAGPITMPDNNYFSQTNIRTSVVGELTLISGGSNGTLESTTFDTGITDGAALNSIMWLGTLGTGMSNLMNFQIATANCPNGATDPPSCTSNSSWGGSKVSGDGAFIGPDGSSATFYVPSSGPGVPVAVTTLYHNNKRYFRYKIILDKNAAAANTAIRDILINWSP